jgi:predicted peroxiredoxin
MAKKLVILCAHGAEDPERAANLFVKTTAAHASDVDVIMGFQANVVTLASKGAAEPVEDLCFG